jgi:organic hydroperoxide reductase OsmC/OhrA
MAGKEHHYTATVTWTSNPGEGTSRRGNHSRNHEIAIEGKPAIMASSDSGFRGDASRHNPEDLLVASLSACHMLWYLSLCGRAGIAVLGYVDRAEGTLVENATGGGRFTAVVLKPEIVLAAVSDRERAGSLHHEAHEKCFISQSVNFPVTMEATYREG